MRVMRIAQVPPPAVPYTATIKEAIPKMEMDKGCAIAVVKGKRLAGTLSKDDVLRRVIANGLDPDTTTVGEVMTWPSLTVTTDADAQEALALMFSNHQCYLPVVDLEGSIKGWLSAICFRTISRISTASLTPSRLTCPRMVPGARVRL